MNTNEAPAAETKPKLKEPLTLEYEDGRRETVIVRRLTNTNLLTWIDAGFDKQFLVFRSLERADKSAKADQAWFDTLTQESAIAVVNKALELNHSREVQKKILEPIVATMQSWLSATPSSSFAPEATTQTA